jgi:predicted nuclease of predicted toxin-antitoxin system
MRFHLDEHVDSAVAEGLRRRGIDVTTTTEAALQGAPDLAHLHFARDARRVIVTHDDDFLSLASRCVEHCGIVYCHQQSRSAGEVIEFLVLIHACLTEQDMLNHVEFC